jgi:hypothetical protein
MLANEEKFALIFTLSVTSYIPSKLYYRSKNLS